MPWNRTPKNVTPGGSPKEVKQKCPMCGDEVWSLPSDKKIAMQTHKSMAHDSYPDDDE